MNLQSDPTTGVCPTQANANPLCAAAWLPSETERTRPAASRAPRGRRTAGIVARMQLGIPTTTRDRRLDVALALAPSSEKVQDRPALQPVASYGAVREEH